MMTPDLMPDDDDLLAQWWIMPLILAATAFILSCVWVSRANAAGIPKSEAIDCIIGEAEGEGYVGKVAIAQALANRGTTKGVYGCQSVRIKERLYSSHTFVQAVKAYEEAKHLQDITQGATGWGNAADLRIFKRSNWFKECRITVKIGAHYFYACAE